MNELKSTWQRRTGRRGGRRLLLGLLLTLFGGFWLLKNSEIADPAKVVIPAAIILLGIANLFTPREISHRIQDANDE
jgi:hypothetical protein